MPEGPEIRRAADKVATALAGRPTTDVYFAFDHLQPYAAELTGRVVTAVEPRGKALLTRFDNDLVIYSHNQLYGQWLVRPARDLPETRRQLRLAIYNAERSALLYSASDIAVLHAMEVDDHPYIRKLGPEVLDPAVTVGEVAAQFGAERFRRRRLYGLLLDQGFIAGLGNYLRSEILFVAGVHPDARPVDCSAESITALADAAVTLTRRSYTTGGITNDAALVARLKAAGVARRDYRWWVFGRDGQPCHRCGTLIDKQTFGGRRLYLCPTCQPRPAAHAAR